MKKLLFALVTAMLLLVFAVACRPTNDPIDAALLPGRVAEWKAKIGPTTGPCNPNSAPIVCDDVAAELIRSNPGAYGYTRVSGKQILPTGSRLNHVWVDGGCLEAATGATDIIVYDLLIDVNCISGSTEVGINPVPAASPIQVWDTEVTITRVGGVVTSEATGIGDGNYDCHRCDIHGFRKNFWASHNSNVIDSLAYDMDGDPGGGHLASVFTKWANNVTIDHTYMVANLKDPGDCCVTGAISATNNPNEDDWKTNLTVKNSFFDPGDWVAIDFGPASAGQDGGQPDDHVTIQDNVFYNTGAAWYYHQNVCGALGTSNKAICYVTSWPGSINGNVWSGNHNENGVLINET